MSAGSAAVVRHDGWIATFADLAALLLTFFVLTFSMAVVEPARLTGGTVQIEEEANDEPDFATNLSELTAPEEIEPDVSQNYLLALILEDLREPSQALAFNLMGRGQAVELVFANRLKDTSEINEVLSEIMPILESLQRRISFTISLFVDDVDTEMGVAWSMELFKRGSYRESVEEVSVGLSAGRLGSSLRLRLSP